MTTQPVTPKEVAAIRERHAPLERYNLIGSGRGLNRVRRIVGPPPRAGKEPVTEPFMICDSPFDASRVCELAKDIDTLLRRIDELTAELAAANSRLKELTEPDDLPDDLLQVQELLAHAFVGKATTIIGKAHLERWEANMQASLAERDAANQRADAAERREAELRAAHEHFLALRTDGDDESFHAFCRKRGTSFGLIAGGKSPNDAVLAAHRQSKADAAGGGR